MAVPTRMRSSTAIRCGEVYRPTVRPCACRIAASSAAVEPLPLVPSTRTDGNARFGAAEGVERALHAVEARKDALLQARGEQRLGAPLSMWERHRASVSLSSWRGTTMSSIPCSRRNSARWNPSGSFCRIVCSITRGPAKPISAPGSPMLRSPSIAYEAVTPPVVGSVSTEMYGSRVACRRARAVEILAICISDRIPSCMRAPPEHETTISGSRLLRQRSIARVSFSPTAEPIEPPMNAYSMAPITVRMPASLPTPTSSASQRTPFSRRSRRRCA